MSFNLFGKKPQNRNFNYTPRYYESEESASKSKIQFVRPKLSKGTKGSRNAKTVLMLLIVIVMALFVFYLKNDISSKEVYDAKFTPEHSTEEVVSGTQTDSGE
jgi:hypothetical protein